MEEKKIVAIDGDAGSGKTSIAQKLAERLGYAYVDSGAMYRTLTLAWIYKIGLGKDASDFQAKFFSELKNNDSMFMPKIDIGISNGKQINTIAGKSVDDLLNHIEVTQRIKPIADHRRNRDHINKILQNISRESSIVVNGRDMTTVVFPNAKFKYYVSAPLFIRARRRLRQMINMGNSTVSYQEIMEQLMLRDEQDKSRLYGGLKQATDAIAIDTSKCSLNKIVEKIAKNVNTS